MPISTEATQLGRLVKAQDEAKYRRNDVLSARGRRARRRATEISAQCAENAAAAEAAVNSGRMFDVVADHIIDAEVARWSAKVPLRHPIPQPPIADAADHLAVELLQQPAAPVIGLAPHDDRTLSEIPGLVVALSGTRIATKYRGAAEELRKRRAHLLRIAADPSLHTDYEGNEAIVQHARSGLRAQFTVAAGGMGDIFSKPYEAGGVRLIGDSPGDWQTYVGFGIGAVIYWRGADFFPDVRWRVQATSDYSYGLRRKLHADDPWRWGAQSCAWCDANGRWENLRQEDMVAHPPAGQLS